MATRVRSYSKINLGLAIGPVRADGFHPLTTLYQTLALHDLVTVDARRLAAGEPSKISLTTNHPEVPTDARNTAWRIVERTLARTGVAAEVAIHIQKELPVQGGLGAGSANAAAALNGLQRELGLMVQGRLEMAAEVGSDVPLFLVGGAVLGTGRGEQVAAMPDLPVTWCVVAVPEVGVSTPRAFQEWDGLCAAKAAAGGGLTSPPQPDRLKELSHVYASVFGGHPATEQASDTSGIVRSRQGSSSSETKQGGLEGKSKTSEQGSALNGLAGNTLNRSSFLSIPSCVKSSTN
jgi:4-diphosphocytidyl-2-C-methyl-D-erythritol kinase